MSTALVQGKVRYGTLSMPPPIHMTEPPGSILEFLPRNKSSENIIQFGWDLLPRGKYEKERLQLILRMKDDGGYGLSWFRRDPNTDTWVETKHMSFKTSKEADSEWMKFWGDPESYLQFP